MKKIAISAAILASMSSLSALAAEPKTFYGAIDLGSWSQKNSSFADPSVIVVSGGYRFTSQVAVELGLYLPGYTKLDYGSGNTVTAKQSAFRASAVGTLPISEKFDLFGKVGVSSIYGQQDGTGVFSNTYATTSNLMVGVGGQFNFNKSFGLRLQYESLGQRKLAPSATAVDISVTSLGFVYTF